MLSVGVLGWVEMVFENVLVGEFVEVGILFIEIENSCYFVELVVVELVVKEIELLLWCVENVMCVVWVDFKCNGIELLNDLVFKLF